MQGGVLRRSGVQSEGNARVKSENELRPFFFREMGGRVLRGALRKNEGVRRKSDEKEWSV